MRELRARGDGLTLVKNSFEEVKTLRNLQETFLQGWAVGVTSNTNFEMNVSYQTKAHAGRHVDSTLLLPASLCQ